MNPIARLALSLALIFPVFSFFSLFGQPRSFIPPLYADHFLLLVFCGYCIFKVSSFTGKLVLTCAGLSIFINGFLEINNAVLFVKISPEISVTFNLFSLLLFLFVPVILLFQPGKLFYMITKLAWLIFCIFQLLSFFEIAEEGILLFILYLFAGSSSFISVLKMEKTDSFHRSVFLLFTLLVYYDLFTYASLQWL